MDAQWRTSIWQQFGAAIDMLAQALRTCPDELWDVSVWADPYAKFWNIAYHTLFWLDLYLSGSADGFVPPAPFTLDELDPAGLLPERPFTREELLAYLQHARTKCQTTVAALTDERTGQRCAFSWGDVELTFAELLLYTMRHVQEHASQLNLLLGQRLGAAPDWVSQAETGHRDG
ncbi:MAG: DinB family protein [Dehalococcoidia bacterium]